MFQRFPYLRQALSRIPSRAISSLYLEGPSGDVFRMRSDGDAVVLIRRIEFDHLLVSLAMDAGARTIAPAPVEQARQDSSAVTLTTRDGRMFRAPMVIAADGVNSVVARRLGLNPGWPTGQIALDMMEETPTTALRSADPETLWVFYGYGGAEGYAYVFPKPDHVNVGIGYLLSYFRERVEEHPYALQRRFVVATLASRAQAAQVDDERRHRRVVALYRERGGADADGVGFERNRHADGLARLNCDWQAGAGE